MKLYGCEEAFGAGDKTTSAMRKAQESWVNAYYGSTAAENGDPCQRIAYSVVGKLMKTIFGEYKLTTEDPFLSAALTRLDARRKEAMQMMMVFGECYIKPCPAKDGFTFTLIPRDNVLIFGRDGDGVPTDIGTAEKSTYGNFYYTLLERRRLDEAGRLIIENKLYRSTDGESLGSPAALSEQPQYAQLPESYCYETPMGLGMVRLRTPMLNCVDGSADGVAVYAAAMGLIENIDRNERLLTQEFERGQSRVFVSSDLLDPESRELTAGLFVGLDDDPEHTGLTVYSPALRQEAFLARKQEYLRNVESVLGLRRGMLSDANIEDRTATEITSSAGDYNLTVIDLQHAWEAAVKELAALCCTLGRQYRLPGAPAQTPETAIDWGNGVLYDEDKMWESYRGMVADGLLKPEIALGWRFNLPVETEEQRASVREKLMPQT